MRHGEHERSPAYTISTVARARDDVKARDTKAPVIEEKFDEIRQLMLVGKEKGFLLFDEINEMLPAEITSSEDLDDLFSTFNAAGIEVVETEEKYKARKLLQRSEDGNDEPDLDLTPSAIDKTNDPVRMYLREMGTVPLLTREGEVQIAKRIERGKLSIIKAISRTPTIAKVVIQLGEQLRTGDRTIRELVIFQDEELTDDRVADRARQVLRQVEAVKKARLDSHKKDVKLGTISRRDKRKYRRSQWRALRARVELSRLIRLIEFTEPVKRRLIDLIKDSVGVVQRTERRDRPTEPSAQGQVEAAATQGGRAAAPDATAARAASAAARTGHRHGADRGGAVPHPGGHPAGRDPGRAGRRKSWSRPTSDWSSRSPRSTRTAAFSSSISFRRATSAS